MFLHVIVYLINGIMRRLICANIILNYLLLHNSLNYLIINVLLAIISK